MEEKLWKEGLVIVYLFILEHEYKKLSALIYD